MLCNADVAADASTRGDLRLADANLLQDRDFARRLRPPAIRGKDGKAQHGVRNDATRTGCELVAAVLGGKWNAVSGGRGGSDGVAGLLALPQSLFADPEVLGLADSAQSTTGMPRLRERPEFEQAGLFAEPAESVTEDGDQDPPDRADRLGAGGR